MAKQKAKRKTGKVPQPKINKQTYFESLRLKRLPLGKCYIKLNYPEPYCYSVIITRTHINSNLSFSEFVLHCRTGEIFDAFYEFNVEPWEFHVTYDQAQFTEFEDHYSLQNLIYSAEAQYLNNSDIAFEYPLPSDFHQAKLILDDLELIAKDSDSIKLLADFQAQGTAFTRDPAPLNAKEKLDRISYYHPEEMRNWKREDWVGYFNLIRPMKSEDRLKYNVSPLAYLYEIVFWDEHQVTPKLSSDMKRLKSKETAKVIDEHYPDFGYELGQEELILMDGIFRKLRTPMDKNDIQNLIREITPLKKKYPKNPAFANQYHYCYERLPDEKMMIETAEYALKQHPDNPDALINYMRVMIKQDNHHKIDAVLQGNYLLDDMIPAKKSFYSGDFLNYYFLLFQHLMHTGQFEAGRLLHAAIQNYDAYHKVSSQKQALWNAFYTYAASHVAEIIGEVIAMDKDTEDLITGPMGL